MFKYGVCVSLHRARARVFPRQSESIRKKNGTHTRRRTSTNACLRKLTTFRSIVHINMCKYTLDAGTHARLHIQRKIPVFEYLFCALAVGVIVVIVVVLVVNVADARNPPERW